MIWYDMIWWTILTCAQKLTRSQLSLNNVPAKNAEDEIEHEKRADNHNWDEVKPVESSAKRVVRLTTNSTTGFFNHVGCFHFAPGRGAKYCDERVCLSVCLHVRSHIAKTTIQTSRNLQCILLPVAAARSSSDDNATRYVLPVLCLTSLFSHNRCRWVKTTETIPRHRIRICTISYWLWGGLLLFAR